MHKVSSEVGPRKEGEITVAFTGSLCLSSLHCTGHCLVLIAVLLVGLLDLTFITATIANNGTSQAAKLRLGEM